MNWFKKLFGTNEATSETVELTGRKVVEIKTTLRGRVFTGLLEEVDGKNRLIEVSVEGKISHNLSDFNELNKQLIKECLV